MLTVSGSAADGDGSLSSTSSSSDNGSVSKTALFVSFVLFGSTLISSTSAFASSKLTSVCSLCSSMDSLAVEALWSIIGTAIRAGVASGSRVSTVVTPSSNIMVDSSEMDVLVGAGIAFRST